MENEEMIESEARIVKQNQLGVGNDKHKAERSVNALGGFPPNPPPAYEDTPLLAREHSGYSGDGGEDVPDNSAQRASDWTNTEFDHLPWWRRPSVYWIIPPFLIAALAYGAIIVTKLNLIQDLICEQYFMAEAHRDPAFFYTPVVLGQENPQCRGPEVTKQATEFMLVASLLSGTFSAIVAPILGAYSDRNGRPRVIALTSVGTVCGEIITIVVARRSDIFSVYWIFLGFALEGLCGSFIAGGAISNAYASDCTPPTRRARAFALFHACLFTGIGFGPLISALVVEQTGDILNAFYIAIASHASFILFMAFVVPESLSKKRQLDAREKWENDKLTAQRMTTHSYDLSRLNYMIFIAKNNRFVKALAILRPTGPGSSRPLRRNLTLLAAVDFTCFGVAMGSMTVSIYYSKLAFGWGNTETQQFVSIVNVSRVAALVVILPALTRIFRGPPNPAKQSERHAGADNFDLGIIRLAIIFDLLGYVGYSVAGALGSGGLFILSGALAASGGMVSPTLQSALTRHIPPDRTGQLLGAIAMLHAVARILAPALFNGLFALTVESFPQATYVCLAAAFGIAELLSWFVRPHVFFDEPAASDSRPGTAGSNAELQPEEEELIVS